MLEKACFSRLRVLSSPDRGLEPDSTPSDTTATSTVKSNKISDIIIKREHHGRYISAVFATSSAKSN